MQEECISPIKTRKHTAKGCPLKEGKEGDLKPSAISLPFPTSQIVLKQTTKGTFREME